MGFFKAIGDGLKKARDWVFPDEVKLRKVNSENYKDAPAEEYEEEKKETAARYDPWEEIDNFKMNFFLGGWATRKFKGGVIGEDKVKKELEELEKKRAEKEGRPYQTHPEQEPEKTRSHRSSLEEELEKIEQERREKERRREEKRSK